MQFTYTARNESGKELTGTIEAASKLEAADKLFNDKKLTVLSLEKSGEAASTKSEITKPAEKPKLDVNTTKTRVHIGQSEAAAAAVVEKPKRKINSLGDLTNSINDFLIDYTSISTKDKVVFFRLLAVMINAGLPIVKALKILSEQTHNPRFKIIIREIANDVEGGENFSNALSDYNDVFSEAEIGVIASGEASGQLNKILTDLANESEKSANLKSKIKSALIYPVVVLVILVLVTIVVMTSVIPKLAELFTSGGVELPATTQALITTSNWFTAYTLFLPNWALFIVAMIGVALAVKAWKKTPGGKLIWDSLMLKMPVFGPGLQMKIALADFARQLSTLTASGISIVRALEITAGALGNEVYRQRIRDIKEDVEQGIPIHQSIEEDHALFPSLVTSMIAVGEQTAQLGTVTKKIADFYENEVDTFVGNMSKIMEPFIIVFVGLLVGGLVAAIMQPIMQIADIAAVQ